MEGSGRHIHVILPPAFGQDPKVTTVLSVPDETRGVMWSNERLTGNDAMNLTHLVNKAPMTSYQELQTNHVHQSDLGLEPCPPPKLVHNLPATKHRDKLVMAYIELLTKEKTRKKEESQVKSDSKGDQSVIKSSDQK